MRRLLVFLLVIFTIVSLPAVNKQKIYPVDSEIYEALTYLYIHSGYALPSTAGPWSGAELLELQSRIDRSKLSPPFIDYYDFVTDELSEGDKPFKFGLDLAIEGYYHLDTDNFVNETDWIRGYDERKPLIDIILETWPGDYFYGYTSIPLVGSKFNNYTAEEGGVSYYFGATTLDTNIFFIPGYDKFGSLDFTIPFRAFGSVGGQRWSIQIGFDKLSWGPGLTGNFMLDKHVKYHNVGRLAAYKNNFKYTLVTSFFPHPSSYYPIIDETTGEFIVPSMSSSIELPPGLNVFLGHRLEWRMFKNKVGFALSEAMMFQSEDVLLDLRVFNPSAIFHNYYIRNNSNSLLTVEIDYTPIKGLNIYGQLAIDEITAPGIESKPGVDDGANPAAHAFMLGAKVVYPVTTGLLYGSLEGAYTNPYLYLRDRIRGVTGYDEYGINYVVAIREVYDVGGFYDETFLGYEYGPDAITFNLNLGYKQLNKWNVEGNIFYMLHGTHDKWTMWSRVGADESSTYPPFHSTPTTSHDTDNYGDLNTDARDSVSRTFVIGVKGGYTILKNFDVYAQVDYINIVNPKNISTNAPWNDVQITLGLSYSL